MADEILLRDASVLVFRHREEWRHEVLNQSFKGLPSTVDPLLLSLMMGAITTEESLASVTKGGGDDLYKGLFDTVKKMRRWSLRKWVGKIAETISTRLGRQPAPHEDPATWLTRRELSAWNHARDRAGELITSLGDRWTAKVDRTIRQATAEAIHQRTPPADLAKQLKENLAPIEADWERIAQTELQGAYNEGAIAAAVEEGGPGVRIARIPEAGACPDCRRLFLTKEKGTPRIFRADRLIANGTNYGRKRADWLPTIWPIHPRCRCSTQVIPKGYGFGRGWRIVKRTAVGAEAATQLLPPTSRPKEMRHL